MGESVQYSFMDKNYGQANCYITLTFTAAIGGGKMRMVDDYRKGIETGIPHLAGVPVNYSNSLYGLLTLILYSRRTFSNPAQ